MVRGQKLKFAQNVMGTVLRHGLLLYIHFDHWSLVSFWQGERRGRYGWPKLASFWMTLTPGGKILNDRHTPFPCY